MPTIDDTARAAHPELMDLSYQLLVANGIERFMAMDPMNNKQAVTVWPCTRSHQADQPQCWLPSPELLATAASLFRWRGQSVALNDSASPLLAAPVHTRKRLGFPKDAFVDATRMTAWALVAGVLALF